MDGNVNKSNAISLRWEEQADEVAYSEIVM